MYAMTPQIAQQHINDMHSQAARARLVRAARKGHSRRSRSRERGNR